MQTEIASVQTRTEPEFLNSYRTNLLSAINSLDLSRVNALAQILLSARNHGSAIFVCGNGGSASTASHFACDIVKGASYQRHTRFRIMALTDSLPTITAYSNDVNYDSVFAEQLKNFAKPQDVLICISGSGNSPNILRAAEYANSIGCTTVALTGFAGGKLGGLANLEIRAGSNHMGQIEDAHLAVCHMVAYLLMEMRTDA